MFKAFGILEIHCLSHDVHVEPHHFSAALSCAMAAPAVTELNGILATVPITGEYNLQVHMAGFRLDFIGFSHEVKGFFPTLSQTGSAFSVMGNASLGVILLETCWLICSLQAWTFLISHNPTLALRCLLQGRWDTRRQCKGACR